MPKPRKSKKIKPAVGLNPAEFVDLARANPYLHRLAEDPSIRENAQRAFESARRAIDRLNHARNPAKALIDDRKLQSELRTAIEAIRDASIALTEAPRRTRARRRCRVRRLALLGGLGGIGALAASEGLRGKVLDLLFGAEEEFQYTPPSDYSPPSDSGPSAAAAPESPESPESPAGAAAGE
jgi:hypothetical protein